MNGFPTRRLYPVKRDWRAEREIIRAHVARYSRDELAAVFYAVAGSIRVFWSFRHRPWVMDDTRHQVIAARMIRDRAKREGITLSKATTKLRNER
jgi:hypothetical protein